MKKSINIANFIYLMLIIFTLITYQLGKFNLSSLNISLFVFFIAIVKVAMISEYFMQLKFVKGFWRLPVIIWLILLSIVIFIAFTS